MNPVGLQFCLSSRYRLLKIHLWRNLSACIHMIGWRKLLEAFNTLHEFLLSTNLKYESLLTTFTCTESPNEQLEDHLTKHCTGNYIKLNYEYNTTSRLLLGQSGKEKVSQHIKHNLKLSRRHCGCNVIRIEFELFQGFHLLHDKHDKGPGRTKCKSFSTKS